MAQGSAATVAVDHGLGARLRRHLGDQVCGERRVHLLLLVDEPRQTVVVLFPFLRHDNTVGGVRHGRYRLFLLVFFCYSPDRCAFPLLSVPTTTSTWPPAPWPVGSASPARPVRISRSKPWSCSRWQLTKRIAKLLLRYTVDPSPPPPPRTLDGRW